MFWGNYVWNRSIVYREDFKSHQCIFAIISLWTVSSPSFKQIWYPLMLCDKFVELVQLYWRRRFSKYLNVIMLIFSFFEISMATQLNRFKVPFSFNVLCQVFWNWYSGSGSEKKTFKNCQYVFTISLLSFFKMDVPLHFNQFHRIFPKGCFRSNLVKINQWLWWKFPLSINFYNVYIVFLWK